MLSPTINFRKRNITDLSLSVRLRKRRQGLAMSFSFKRNEYCNALRGFIISNAITWDEMKLLINNVHLIFLERCETSDEKKTAGLEGSEIDFLDERIKLLLSKVKPEDDLSVQLTFNEKDVLLNVVCSIFQSNYFGPSIWLRLSKILKNINNIFELSEYLE